MVTVSKFGQVCLKCPSKRRIARIANLKQFVAEFPKLDAELSDVVKFTAEKYSLPRVKAGYARTRAFYTKQIAKLEAAREGISARAFFDWAGNLLNCIKNTESASWLRAKGLPFGEKVAKPSISSAMPNPYHAGTPSDRPILTGFELNVRPRTVKLLPSKQH